MKELPALHECLPSMNTGRSTCLVRTAHFMPQHDRGTLRTRERREEDVGTG